MRIKMRVITTRLLLVTVTILSAPLAGQAAEPQGSSGGTESSPDRTPATYCNPLPLPDIPLGKLVRQQNRASNLKWEGPDGRHYLPGSDRDRWLEGDEQDCRELADPTMLAFKGRWYLFPSSLPGPVWISDDLVQWKYQPLGLTIAYAPTVAQKGEWLYLVASGSKMVWRAQDPLGPWEELGPMKDKSGQPKSCFDPCLFVDDDGRMYVYYGGNVARLRDDNPTQFAEDPLSCISVDLDQYPWARAGTHNQNVNTSYTEGPWMTKHRGRYYLQFSVAGTQYRSYAVGCLVGDTPYGPWRMQKRNPILIQKGGLVNGTAHHAVFPGPGGKLWCIYTTLVRITHFYERRLAMDPVGFDADGEMFIAGPTETPQWGPGVKADPAQGNDTGWVNLSCDPQRIRASSSVPGRDPVYACDDNIRTWWEAAGSGPQWLEVDLGLICKLRAFRTLFADRGLNLRAGALPGPYRYLIEGSLDGMDWRTLADQSKNPVDRQIAYDTCPETRARYVRITVQEAPQGMRIGLWEFTAFGNAVSRAQLQ